MNPACDSGASGILAALRAIVGRAHVLEDAESCVRYGLDRTAMWSADPLCVVRPASTAEVQAIVRAATRFGVPLVPSGGRTGLSGGAVACRREVVLSLERMNTLLEFNAEDRTLTVEAGMITADVQRHAAAQGLFYPVDFASSGSSHIGGNIATNAGGIRVIRYGMTREQVRGLQVVDGRGEVLELNRGLVKNNTGPDLRHLFIGSEGILGVITQATIALRNPPGEIAVMLLGVADFGSIMRVLRQFSDEIQLSAFEFFGHNGLQKVLGAHDWNSPLGVAAPFYVLLEFEQHLADAGERALVLFERGMAQGLILDGVLSQSIAQARQLWRLREQLSETLSRWKPYKNDIGLRISLLPAFIEQAQALIERAYAGMEVVWYGHVGDGNLHLNVLKPESLGMDVFEAFCARVSRQLSALVRDFGGSVSAEHGVGLLKKDLLEFSRSEQELQLLRQIKLVFDPAGIMNPGKVFDQAG